MGSSAEPVLQSRRSLYVGGLGDEVNESILRAAMIPFGPLKSVEIVSRVHHRFDQLYIEFLMISMMSPGGNYC